jgi:hypothetical protein
MNDNQASIPTRDLRRWLALVLAALSAATGFLTLSSQAQTPVYRTEPNGSTTRPPGGFGMGFSGELPEFVVQVPDSRAEVSGEMVAKLGLSWVRDWLKDTSYEGTEPPVPPPLLPGLKTSRDIWFVGRLGFTPIGTIAGLTYGRLGGESAKKIDLALPSITNVMAGLQIPDRFEPLLLGLLQEKWPGAVLLTNRLPHESAFLQPTLMNELVPLPRDWEGMRESRVDVSGFPSADAAVVFRVVSWGLMGVAGRNSPLSVNLIVKGTLVNLRNRTRGKESYAVFQSEKRPFVAWSENDGQPLREELRRGVQSLADQFIIQISAPAPEPSLLATSLGL